MLSKLLNINTPDLHPPKSLWSTFKNAYVKRKNFKKFWKNLNKKNLPEEIIKITDFFVESESYKWSSKLWTHLMIGHYKYMANKSSKEDPLKVIARTDYSGFSFLNEYSIKNSCELLAEKDIHLDLNLFKKHDEFSLSQSIGYNLVLLILYENIKNKDVFKSYDEIKKEIYYEYSPKLKIDGKLVTQHMLSAMLEYEKIKILDSKSKKKSLNILEIGSGYGRTANMVLSLSKNVKYVLVDFPPAIYFAKKNLENTFKDKKIAYGFEIKRKDEMIKKFNESDVLCIFPHQIKLFEKKFFDISVAIGCLNEMKKKDIDNYMKIFEDYSNFLYFKVLENSALPFAFYKYYSIHKKSDYSIKESWLEHFKERCIIPSNQFDLGYEFKD